MLRAGAGGIIAVDNVLWHGHIADPAYKDADTVAIRALNDAVFLDARVSVVTIPMADGITFIRKL